MIVPAYQSQGHKIAQGWDSQALLKDWTAYLGTDGQRFAPPSDRSGYSDGVERRLGTGGVRMSGLQISRLTFPWVSFGQIDFIETTFMDQNVTVAVHKPSSLNKTDLFLFNAVCNVDLNQTQTLTRRGNGYEGFVVELVLVESL